MHQNPAAEAMPGTPGIRDVRIGAGTEDFNPVSTRRGSLRAEVDNYNGEAEFDIKRMEEQTVELEKDLIMKQLETLDFLEALGSTKRIVEDFKWQFQQQALRCLETPRHLISHIKEMVDERCHHKPLKSPELEKELKQASMNLGKTMDDLALIQSYSEFLNKETKEDKDFPGVASLAEELNGLRFKPAGLDQGDIFNTKNSPVNPQCEQVKMVDETSDTTFHKQSKTCLRIAEMRLVAARKMDETARAAEALAIAEMTILSSWNNQDGLCFPETWKSLSTPKAHLDEDVFTEISITEILRKKLEEANEEVKQSKQDLEIALKGVDIASVKQLEAEDAFRQWNIESWKDQKAIGAKRSTKRDSSTRGSFLSHLNQHKPLIDLPKPMLKHNVSVGNDVNWKQAPAIDEKQLDTLRRKFGFIHTHQTSTGETK